MFKRIAAIIVILGVLRLRGPFWDPPFSTERITRSRGSPGAWLPLGAPQGQAPPAIAREWQEEKTVEVEEKGKKTTRTEPPDSFGSDED